MNIGLTFNRKQKIIERRHQGLRVNELTKAIATLHKGGHYLAAAIVRKEINTSIKIAKSI